jgi:hypothetical protein
VVRVVDTGAAGGVEGVVWGSSEVMGVAREAVEVGEAGDGGATQGRTVGPPAPVSRVV